MSDWRAGDLALCVRFHPMYPPEVQPGAIHQVEYVWHGSEDCENPEHIDTALDLTGIERMDGDIAYWARSFVKITPGHTITGSEVDQREPWKVGV